MAAERKRARIPARAFGLVENIAVPATVAAAYDNNARAGLAAPLDAVTEAARLLRQAGAPATTRPACDPTAGDFETVPASRTAPTVEQQNDAAVLSIDTGCYATAVGGGSTLAVLLDEITRTQDVRMPQGSGVHAGPHMRARLVL